MIVINRDGTLQCGGRSVYTGCNTDDLRSLLCQAQVDYTFGAIKFEFPKQVHSIHLMRDSVTNLSVGYVECETLLPMTPIIRFLEHAGVEHVIN